MRLRPPLVPGGGRALLHFLARGCSQAHIPTPGGCFCGDRSVCANTSSGLFLPGMGQGRFGLVYLVCSRRTGRRKPAGDRSQNYHNQKTSHPFVLVPVDLHCPPRHSGMAVRYHNPGAISRGKLAIHGDYHLLCGSFAFVSSGPVQVRKSTTSTTPYFVSSGTSATVYIWTTSSPFACMTESAFGTGPVCFLRTITSNWYC